MARLGDSIPTIYHTQLRGRSTEVRRTPDGQRSTHRRSTRDRVTTAAYPALPFPTSTEIGDGRRPLRPFLLTHPQNHSVLAIPDLHDWCRRRLGKALTLAGSAIELVEISGCWETTPTSTAERRPRPYDHSISFFVLPRLLLIGTISNCDPTSRNAVCYPFRCPISRPSDIF